LRRFAYVCVSLRRVDSSLTVRGQLESPNSRIELNWGQWAEGSSWNLWNCFSWWLVSLHLPAAFAMASSFAKAMEDKPADESARQGRADESAPLHLMENVQMKLVLATVSH